MYCVFSIVHWCLRPGDIVTIMLSRWHNLSMRTVENKPDMKPWIFGRTPLLNHSAVERCDSALHRPQRSLHRNLLYIKKHFKQFSFLCLWVCNWKRNISTQKRRHYISIQMICLNNMERSQVSNFELFHACDNSFMRQVYYFLIIRVRPKYQFSSLFV